MAITKLIVGGFKSLRDRTEISLAPLTLMFGPNSSGKSAVLRAAEKMRELLGEELRVDLDKSLELAKIVDTFAAGPPAFIHRRPLRDEQDEHQLVPPVFGLELDPFTTAVGSTFPDGRHDVLCTKNRAGSVLAA